MEVVFFGSGRPAIPVLEAIANSPKHRLQMVVTQPPRPAGRGRTIKPTPVAQYAGSHGLELLEQADVNSKDFYQRLAARRPDVLVVAAFGQKLGRELLAVARFGAINVHPSLLPKYRGAAPVNWALMDGQTETGVTVFRMTEVMDAGPILAQRRTAIEPDERAEELLQRLAVEGGRLVLEVLDGLSEGRIQPVEQDSTQASRAPKLSKADGRLDFRQPARWLLNRIRGTWSWPGAQCTFVRAARPDKPLKVIVARASLAESPVAVGARPGTVISLKPLLVATGEGLLHLQELLPVGRRVISEKDFVNGYRVQVGDYFTSEQDGHA